MGLYVEFAPAKFSRRGNMVPVTQITTLTGYRSVYCFPEQAAKEIRASGRSTDFNRYDVYSDALVLDFDDGTDSYRKWIEWAKKREIGYSLYFSGKKGYHLELATEPHLNRNVPYSQKQLVKKLGIPCDHSIFRHGSLYRLPGTFHEETGKQKTLLETSMGNAVIGYALVEEPVLDVRIIEDDNSFQEGINRIMLMYGLPPPTGESRTQKLWSLASTLKDGGLSANTVIELIEATNASWGDRAKDSATVERVIREAFTR